MGKLTGKVAIVAGAGSPRRDWGLIRRRPPRERLSGFGIRERGHTDRDPVIL